MPNKIKTVDLGEIDIFFSDKVGILLTNKTAIKIVKYGVKFFILNPKFRSESSKNKGIKINNQAIENERLNISLNDFSNDKFLKLSHGKKNHVIFKVI